MVPPLVGASSISYGVGSQMAKLGRPGNPQTCTILAVPLVPRRFFAVRSGTLSANIGQYRTISDNIGEYRRISATRCFRQISADIGKHRQPPGTSLIRDWKVSKVNPGKALPDETQIELRAEMERFMNGRNRSDRRGERDRGHLEETSAEESTRRGKHIVNRILTAGSSKLGGES